MTGKLLYAKWYRQLHRKDKRSNNRSVLQIINRIIAPIPMSAICDYDPNSHTSTLRNDLLAKAFLLVEEK